MIKQLVTILNLLFTNDKLKSGHQFINNKRDFNIYHNKSSLYMKCRNLFYQHCHIVNHLY